MQADLAKWLDDVWDRRDELLAESKKQGFIKGRGASAGMSKNEGAGLIYDMYNARDASGTSSSDDSHLSAMQRELVLLENAIKEPPEVQGLKFKKMPRGWMANAKTSELSNEFFHYRVKRGECAYRIYVNAVPAARGLVFRNILADQGLWQVPDLRNAKVSSPDDGGRVDTIVIYLATSTATEAALACIAAYHKKEPGNFSGILPKLVEPASVADYKMHGVGTAMEPPGFTLVSTGGQFYQREKGQSFGAYRSELIFMALERTRLNVTGQSEQQRKIAFKNRVEKYFRRAGIDPDRPALQGAVEDLPSIATIQNWANTVDKKLV